MAAGEMHPRKISFDFTWVKTEKSFEQWSQQFWKNKKVNSVIQIDGEGYTVVIEDVDLLDAFERTDRQLLQHGLHHRFQLA